MRPKALLYRLGEETETGCKLRAVLEEQKLPAVTVTENLLGIETGKLVSSNAALPGAPAPAQVPQQPFLLLCALGDRQLDRLLAAMRRSGVSVPYKAVLTAYNRTWTFGRLIEEVEREDRALNGDALKTRK